MIDYDVKVYTGIYESKFFVRNIFKKIFTGLLALSVYTYIPLFYDK